MSSTKYNETFNDEVRWTSDSCHKKSVKNNFNDKNHQLLLTSSAQPTVTSIKYTQSINNQSSVISDDDCYSKKAKNFINSITSLPKCISNKNNTSTKNNKSILYQLFVLIYLVLINIICNNLLLTTTLLLPSCVNADEFMDAPGARGHYTPTWAVHIPGGEKVAQQVADDHGYVLLGKVSANKKKLLLLRKKYTSI